MYPDMF